MIFLYLVIGILCLVAIVHPYRCGREVKLIGKSLEEDFSDWTHTDYYSFVSDTGLQLWTGNGWLMLGLMPEGTGSSFNIAEKLYLARKLTLSKRLKAINGIKKRNEN